MNFYPSLPPGVTRLSRAVDEYKKKGYMTSGEIATLIKSSREQARILFDPPDLVLRRGGQKRNLYLKERILNSVSKYRQA
jgi:hypothetical protein